TPSASGAAAVSTDSVVWLKLMSPTLSAQRWHRPDVRAPAKLSGSPVTATTLSEILSPSSKTARTLARSPTTRSRVCSVQAIRRIHLLLAQPPQQTPTPAAPLDTLTTQIVIWPAKLSPQVTVSALRAQVLRRSTAPNKALSVHLLF